MTEKTPELPKPLFDHIRRMYLAVIDQGVSPASLTSDRGDTVIRKLSKTSWIKENQDLYNLWCLAGEPWSMLLKDVKAYSSKVASNARILSAKKKRLAKIK